jgi:hypothetical protein
MLKSGMGRTQVGNLLSGYGYFEDWLSDFISALNANLKGGLREGEKEVEDAIKKGIIKPEEVKIAADKAKNGDSTDLALMMMKAGGLREAKESNASIYSPTIINASMEQCHWKQMWNWGKGLREVRWIDFQAPLFRRDILEKIQQFPEELIYGWGTDFFGGCVAETNGLKIVVSDNNTITHMNSLTFKENKVNIGVNEFCQRAEQSMYNYFRNSEYSSLYFDLRTYGEQYDINSNTVA